MNSKQEIQKELKGRMVVTDVEGEQALTQVSSFHYRFVSIISLSHSESASSRPWNDIRSLVWVLSITGLIAVPNWPADPAENQNSEKEKSWDSQKLIFLHIPNVSTKNGGGRKM